MTSIRIRRAAVIKAAILLVEEQRAGGGALHRRDHDGRTAGYVLLADAVEELTRVDRTAQEVRDRRRHGAAWKPAPAVEKEELAAVSAGGAEVA